ncbi:MAG: LysM peptidoglycan-binding domain-containing protein [Candidatus Cloacimonetes bacterium]|nr:LysM peptidoglycan-binding domain-containing protein [Candidatus Cloacimonadota bacterium]
MKILAFTIIYFFAFTQISYSAKNKGMSSERLTRIRALFDQLRGSTEKKREEEKRIIESEQKYEFEEPSTNVESLDLNLDLLEDVSVEEAKSQIENNTKIKSVKKVESSIQLKDGELLYNVKPGESLLLIARKMYRDPAKYKEIMSWNDLEKPMLHPNQQLILKGVKSSVVDQIKLIESEEQSSLFSIDKYSYKIYRVRSGDSLSSIAKKFLGRSSYFFNLAKFNKIDAQKYVVVGQKLVIPIKK